MQPEEAKQKINLILENKIKFEGHFNKCFRNLKKTQQQELLQWVEKCKNHETNPIQSKTNRELIGFVKRIGSNLRAILTKEKQKYFLVLFLDKHKYYDTEMKYCGFV